MTDFVERIFEWNKARDNTDFSIELETDMLNEECIELTQALTDAQELDAVADIVFVSIGTLYKVSKKYNINPLELMKIVCDANDKKGSKKNSEGKILKAADFKKPDAHGGAIDKLLESVK